MTRSFRTRRSLLFVPAARPDRYPKALATGADAVCIDLEDGVSFADKDQARSAAIDLFLTRVDTRAEVSLRINDPKTALGQRDIEAVCAAEVSPDAVMLPKCDSPEEVRDVSQALSSISPTLPLIIMAETARGVAEAEAIATASPNVSAMFFGAIDYAADIGCAVEWDAVLFARSRVVLAAAIANVSPIDSPFMNVSALDELADECSRTQALGFVGKAAIHPTQVSIIQQAFTPATAEVAWAKRIIEAYETNNGGVLLVDGKLIERPVIASAKKILALVSTVEDA